MKERGTFTLNEELKAVRLSPVGDRQVSFNLDGYPQEGYCSSVMRINGRRGTQTPGAVRGPQIRDTDLHELTIGVWLTGAVVDIEVQFDAPPLTRCSRRTALVGLSPGWTTPPPGSLALGTFSTRWMVSAVKVKRLERC